MYLYQLVKGFSQLGHQMSADCKSLVENELRWRYV